MIDISKETSERYDLLKIKEQKHSVRILRKRPRAKILILEEQI